MLKVVDKATPATATQGPQIRKEARLCPACAKVYLAELARIAPDVNPRSAYAGLLD